jgi:hypothetical protein
LRAKAVFQQAIDEIANDMIERTANGAKAD